MGNSTIWDGTGWTSAEVDSPYDKARVYIQSSEPTGGRSGDLFVDSDDSTLSYLDGLWRKLKIASTNVIGLETLLSTLAPLVHQHAASDISSGTLDTARIPDLDASKVTSGTLADARIPNLSASKTNSGTFDVARIPDLDAAKVASGTLAVARIPNLDAAKISTGTLDIDRLPTGTSGTTVALGNHTHTKAHITDFAHTHAAADIVSGTLDVARIPDMDTAKITTGTLPAARLPVATDTEAIAGSLTTKLVTPANLRAVVGQTYSYEAGSPDLNAYLTTGNFVFDDTATNTPAASSYGTLSVRRGPAYVAQQYQLNTSPHTVWTRTYTTATSTWSAWRCVDPVLVTAEIGLGGTDSATLTSSNYKSIKLGSTNNAINFTPIYNGDCLILPQTGWVSLMFQCIFTAVDTGNRFVGMNLNPGITTLNGAGYPSTGRLTYTKFAPSSDTVGGVTIWEGPVTAGDNLMYIARSTVSGVKVGGALYETRGVIRYV